MENIYKKEKITLINDNFQNYKRYNLKKADFIIADIPYNLAKNAYASRAEWWKDGNVKNGVDKSKANKAFFNSDFNFNLYEFMHFSTRMLKNTKEHSGTILFFCSFIQQFLLINLMEKYGFKKYINLVFRKKTSASVLKANMRIVGNCEYGLLIYKDKLPKFNNDGKMVFNCFDWDTSGNYERIHPTQKPVALLKKIIKLFTDENDVVIDPCCGSGSTLRACLELNRISYGFEINKEMFKLSKEKMLSHYVKDIF